ncbi:hypothetical protein OOJ91_33710 [Micromonospora lupini]|uniref:hypothetical protein n=1 Tax=Micromonospora lupini TaxID=285679 RepID=UPI0022542C02|nr:hypothetical protein [Micromonospora lupini]MCX5070804.1 hypothetical protein [Micromonospora lupini]
METTRGLEATRALTQVRTVLSRAETARKILDGPTEYHTSDDAGGIDFDRGKYEDPDAAEMRAALDQVVELLSRWRKTGRATSSTPGA